MQTTLYMACGRSTPDIPKAKLLEELRMIRNTVRPEKVTLAGPGAGYAYSVHKQVMPDVEYAVYEEATVEDGLEMHLMLLPPEATLVVGGYSTVDGWEKIIGRRLKPILEAHKGVRELVPLPAATKNNL